MSEEHIPAKRQITNALARITILVVDSNEAIRELMGKVLTELGFEKIVYAENGYEGIKKLSERWIDLVITDWDLHISDDLEKEEYAKETFQSEWGGFPPNNGASFVKFIRLGRGKADRFVPIIMMTGPVEPDVVLHARDSGVNEILMKPIDSKNLCKRIINLVDRPRPFVTSENYFGPCRRRKVIPLEKGMQERRVMVVEIIKFQKYQQREGL